MNIKVYEGYSKPIVSFFHLGKDICYRYESNIEKVNLDTLNILKEQLELPYKVSFYGINRANIGRILKDMKDEDTEIFCYPVKNPKTNLLKYHAIFTKKIKIKKLEK